MDGTTCYSRTFETVRNGNMVQASHPPSQGHGLVDNMTGTSPAPPCGVGGGVGLEVYIYIC